MARYVPFTLHEAVLLLDGYLLSLSTDAPRLQIAEKVSNELRQMALNQGQAISENHRNVNGVTFQMASMESAYLGYTIRVSATRLFSEVVSLYRHNRDEYDKLLQEARLMVAKQDINATQTAASPEEMVKQALKDECANNQYGTTVAYLYTKVRGIRAPMIKQILDQAPWAIIELGRYHYVEPITPVQQTARPTPPPAPKVLPRQDGSQTVNFTSCPNLSFTKPTKATYFGDDLQIKPSWTDTYVQVFSVLYDDYSPVIPIGSSFSGTGRPDLGDRKVAESMVDPKAIAGADLFLETNLSATDIVGKIKALLDICNVDYENVRIEYENRPKPTAETGRAKAEKADVHRPTIADAPTPKEKTAGEGAFYRFLRDDAKLADRTCRAYISAIWTCERFAKKHNYSSVKMYNCTHEETFATAQMLLSDPEFVKINRLQHNTLSAAINNLLEFIGVKKPQKAVPSPNTGRKQRIASPKQNTEIASVLKQHYEYGFKYNSIRELMRFRQFADGMGIALPKDDEALKTLILASGTIIDDKVYSKNDDMSQELQRIVNDIFASGVGVIYYERLFEKKQEWMESYTITSPDMLKEHLKKISATYAFSKKFVSSGSRRPEAEAITDELKRIWGPGPSENLCDLYDRLPYIPSENIWRVITGSDLFLSISKGEYLLLDRFSITEQDEDRIINYVETTCKANGFASLGDIPLGDIEEEYYELPQFAICNAIYKKVLATKYHLNGKILTKESSDLDAVTLLREYIKSKDECTFDEVADKAAELTGGANRQYAFQALYDEMVRVGENRFVANRFVHFDVDEIDTTLSGFITENFRAIRDVTTFAMFPICGQSWNHYLLESFCYKYSRKYSLHVIYFNNKNAGIIAERECNKQYNEMLAIALARADIELRSDVAGQYLSKTGYTAKSKYANLDEIVQQALELRKER